ncbi:hypothetical protein [Paenibacillus sp. JZ16]|uniref:hypothetical protein n=1 Tax=Paenibacillus sp. JZ16 TaxID=1906272 RepID=UPI00188B6476|nr:hypothetical protein [Paenibacillus sp. JZ16]
MKRKRFNFRREIGWAEIIASIALIFAVGPIIIDYLTYKSQDSKIEVTQEVPKVFLFIDSKDGKQKMFTYNRLVVTNTGGKTVTLNGFQPNDMPPVILNVVDGRISNQTVEYSIFPLDFLMEDIKNEPDKIFNLKKTSLEALSVINESIEPGITKVLNYGIVFEPFDINKKQLSDLILINFNIKFSDGYEYSFKQGYPVSEE